MDRNEIKNIFKVSSIYIAATIGAGFASGKELFLFFTKYKDQSTHGVLLAGLLFILIGYVLLDYIRKYRPQNINDLTNKLFGKKLSVLFTLLITFFLVGVLSIMLSGMANILYEIFNIPYFASGIIVTFLCFIILIFDIKTIVLLSQLITPFLIIGIITICILLLNIDSSTIIQTNSINSNHYGISAITYISYNIIISVAVLIDAKYLLTSRRTSIFSSMIGGFCLFMTSHLINLVLIKYYVIVISEELPMLTLVKNYNNGAFIIWSLILFLSMLTTAISSAVGSINYMLSMIKIPRNLLVFLFLCFTLRLTYVGFSQLILFFYPLFGYIGFIFILLLSYRYATNQNI